MSGDSLPIPTFGQPIQEVILEAERFSVMQRVADELVMNAADVSKFYDIVRKQSVMEITYHVFGQRLDEQTVEYPADWWQHFKQRWFPAWALRRWPVQKHVRTMKLMGFYPELLGRDRYLHVMVTP